MERYFYDIVGAAQGIVLFVLIVILLRGPLRKFPVLFIYVTAEFLSASVLTIASLVWVDPSNIHAQGSILYDHIFWTSDLVLDLLSFLVVIFLTHEATPEGPARIAVGRLLMGVVAIATVLPFLVFQPKFTPWPEGRWANSASQMLNFAAAIMNLVLWGALIGSRRRDPELLRASAGLGLIVAGEAISYGFRHFAALNGTPMIAANALLQLTQLAGWSIWIWTFWPAPKRRIVREAALPSTSDTSVSH